MPFTLPQAAASLRVVRYRIVLGFLCLFLAVAFTVSFAQAGPAVPSSENTILHAADAGKLLPGAVFFRGQSANIQARNSGGVKFSDGMYVLSALVDNAGYASALQEKYQAYLIAEVPLVVNGHRLNPGAYGVGFQGTRFLVMDIGAHDIFSVDGARDIALARPTPLQVLADSTPDSYRLYLGRNYVVFSRGPGH